MFEFHPLSFIENLAYMGKGMLGIFVVIGVIVGITCLLNFLASKNRKEKQ